MKLTIAILTIVLLCLIPLIPVTSYSTITVEVPEEYTVTESYTEYVPVIRDKAVWHESESYRIWKSSIKTSIEDAALPSGISGYWSIEYYITTKPVTRYRDVVKLRIVSKTTTIESTSKLSVIEWFQRATSLSPALKEVPALTNVRAGP